MDKSKNIEQIYKKKTLLEHIRDVPDTYLGSCETISCKMHICENNKIILKQIDFIAGLYKIFDEILVNARDQSVRSQKCNIIKINIKDNNEISIFNNGDGIPIVIHKEHDVYIPELIFGHLLTSSNYDKTEKRITGGKNGYGAKLTNIFSTLFQIDCVCNKKKYIQKFYNFSKETAIIEDYKESDYTKITFIPDYKKFKIKNLSDDMINLFKKRCYDVLATSRKKLKIYFQNEELLCSCFEDYIKMFFNKPFVYQEFNDRWRIGIVYTEHDGNQISFVNSMATYSNGTHVDYIQNMIFKQINLQLKKKDFKLTNEMIKSNITLFVDAIIENPEFNSQTKEQLKIPNSQFGSKCELTPQFIKSILNQGLLNMINNYEQIQNLTLLKKSDGKKTLHINIEKLDDAEYAGGRYSMNCRLFIVEGDSAKTLAVSGLSVIGRDYYGVFPIRGKLINVRDTLPSKINANLEIVNLKQILGLKQGMADTTGLRYGGIIILTDQDVDGAHIKGLIMNFIHYFCPNIIIKNNFIHCLNTPILKITSKKSKTSKWFYNVGEFEKWKTCNDINKFTLKYYKGLGTSTSNDAKEYFKDIEQKLINYIWDDKSEFSLNLAFNKNLADSRKSWLQKYDKHMFLNYDNKNITYSEFIDKELIHFSNYDNLRSIPSVIDGLKPSQRKILHTCFQKNIVGEIKVAQLTGLVAFNTDYHHGEESLSKAIIGLAQNFIGSNNINLLYPEGAFGTRLAGGTDSASSRYIFSHLSKITYKIFRKEDLKILNYLKSEDESQYIEPEFFVPIFPMILVNGAKGIGTGYSTSIECYNPKDIIKNIYNLMDNKKLIDIYPYYRNFTGEVTNTHYIGTYKYNMFNNILEITELPIGSWTNDFKNLLMKYRENKIIKSYSEHYTDITINFKINLINKLTNDEIIKMFYLKSSYKTTNMYCYDDTLKLVKYQNVNDIIKKFYDIRLHYYDLRKKYLLKYLHDQSILLTNKIKYILGIINKKININNRNNKDVYEILENYKLDKLGSSDDPYDYLLHMHIRSLTKEKIDELQKECDECNNKYDDLNKKSLLTLWKNDLHEFLTEYSKLY